MGFLGPKYGSRLGEKWQKNIFFIPVLFLPTHFCLKAKFLTAIASKPFKGTVTDMRYFARSKFPRSLVHKKKFSLIFWSSFQVRICILSLNELREKLRAAMILGKFVNKPWSTSHWLIVFGKCFSVVKT